MADLREFIKGFQILTDVVYEYRDLQMPVRGVFRDRGSFRRTGSGFPRCDRFFRTLVFLRLIDYPQDQDSQAEKKETATVMPVRRLPRYRPLLLNTSQLFRISTALFN